MGFKMKIFIIGKKQSEEAEILEYIKKWESITAKDLFDRCIELTDKLLKIADEAHLPPWIIASVMQAAAQDVLESPRNESLIATFRKYKEYVDRNFIRKEPLEAQEIMKKEKEAKND